MGRGYKSSRSSAHTRDSIRSKPRAPPDFNPADAKIAAINSYEDVADEVDDFHLQRDKVLLENGGSRAGRARRGRDMDEESEVEEVYGLGTDEDDEEDEDDEDLEEYASTNEEDEDDDGEFTKRARGASNLSDDDEEEDRDDEEEGVEGWGTSRSAYYGGNEADITTEQDAFDEEAEARRIQKKQLASMTAEDFMLDLDEWSTSATKPGSTITAKKTITITKTTETLPTAIPSDLSPAARLSLLKSRNPEFELLSTEFLELQKIYPVLAAQAERGGEVSQLRYKTLTAYLGVLAMYFALLSRDQTGSWTGVKEHGVMDGLVRCRELWEKVKGLEEEEEQQEESEDEQVNGVGKDVDMVDGELDSVDEYDEEEETEDISPEPKPVRRQLVVSNGKPTAPRKRAKLDLALETPPTATKIPSKFTHAIPTTATDLSDLAALIPTSKSKSTSTKKASKPTMSSSTKLNKNNDFTDPTTLSSADLSEKSSRKSSLRFHASQLLSKSALRAQAGRHTGGDTDLPRKDKHPERSAIVKRDQSLGDDLDLEEPTAEEKSLARSINGGTTDELDDDLDHYHLLAAQSRKAKRITNSQGGEFTRFPTEEDVDGKRAIGYTIEKNKGLTPHRKKDVRNPRVKKRKAYEKANKKLRTVKRVYSGPSQGAYAGEMTGIKKGVIRSRKLK